MFRDRVHAVIYISVFRVDHFQIATGEAHLAKTTQLKAALERLFLRLAEMEKPERDRAAAIGDTAQQRAPPAIGDFSQQDLTLNHRLIPRPQTSDRHNARTVLIAERQME